MSRDRENALSYAIKQLGWLAECNLATHEMLKNKKSSSQSSVRRQRGICVKALNGLTTLEIAVGRQELIATLGKTAPRVCDFLRQDGDADVWLE